MVRHYFPRVIIVLALVLPLLSIFRVPLAAQSQPSNSLAPAARAAARGCNRWDMDLRSEWRSGLFQSAVVRSHGLLQRRLGRRRPRHHPALQRRELADGLQPDEGRSVRRGDGLARRGLGRRRGRRDPALPGANAGSNRDRYGNRACGGQPDPHRHAHEHLTWRHADPHGHAHEKPTHPHADRHRNAEPAPHALGLPAFGAEGGGRWLVGRG